MALGLSPTVLVPPVEDCVTVYEIWKRGTSSPRGSVQVCGVVYLNCLTGTALSTNNIVTISLMISAWVSSTNLCRFYDNPRRFLYTCVYDTQQYQPPQCWPMVLLSQCGLYWVFTVWRADGRRLVSARSHKPQSTFFHLHQASFGWRYLPPVVRKVTEASLLNWHPYRDISRDLIDNLGNIGFYLFTWSRNRVYYIRKPHLRQWQRARGVGTCRWQRNH